MRGQAIYEGTVEVGQLIEVPGPGFMLCGRVTEVRPLDDNRSEVELHFIDPITEVRT